jgi:hypothetical protein
MVAILMSPEFARGRLTRQPGASRGNLPPNQPITPISPLEELEAAYIRGKLDRWVADHKKNVADQVPRQMVIGGEAALIGR